MYKRQILIPVFQLNDHVDGLRLLDAFHTEQRLHVHDTDAAQLDEMLGNLRGTAYQGVVADLMDLDHVVGNQTVTPLNPVSYTHLDVYKRQVVLPPDITFMITFQS